jgi:hypothetical protein
MRPLSGVHTQSRVPFERSNDDHLSPSPRPRTHSSQPKPPRGALSRMYLTIYVPFTSSPITMSFVFWARDDVRIVRPMLRARGCTSYYELIRRAHPRCWPHAAVHHCSKLDLVGRGLLVAFGTYMHGWVEDQRRSEHPRTPFQGGQLI